MGTKSLKKALKSKNVDDFETGTVVRWTAAGRFTYAAIKTPVGWATTARYGNSYVGSLVTYDELVEILGRSESSDIEVATDWESV